MPVKDARRIPVRGKERIGASFYDLFMAPIESRWGKRWRERLWEGVSGRVLEIGVGTGANLPFYPRDAAVVAVDSSPGMLRRAERKAERLGVRARFVLADVHDLPFPDRNFDYVVGSFLFCSVEDPIPALREVGRVLAADGEARLLEHVRPRSRRLGKVLEILAPHFAKRTWELFPKAGLVVIAEEILDRRGLVRLYRLSRAPKG